MLVNLLQSSKSHLGRMHALYALEGLGLLKEEEVMKRLGDPHATVREHALKLAERREVSKELWAAVKNLATDEEVRVRHQLAFSLGEMKHAERPAVLAEIIKRDVGNGWMRAAVLSSLSEGASEVLAEVSKEGAILGNEAGRAFVRELAVLIGAKNNREEVAKVLPLLHGSSDEVAFTLAAALGEGLQRAGVTLVSVDRDAGVIFAKAREVTANRKAAEPARIEAIRVLGLSQFADSAAVLVKVLDEFGSQAIQLAAIGTLDRFNEPQVAEELIKRWTAMTPRLRSEAAAVLLKRSERALALLKAIEAKKVRIADLSSPQVNFLQTRAEPAVRELAVKVLSATAAPRRDDVVKALMPVLELKGDAAKGKVLFQERCASCHRMGGVGFALGPDLVSAKNAGKEKLLVNILDPNREVPPQYLSYLVETRDGESFLGVIASETGSAVTIRQAFGMETNVLRSRIRKIQSQGLSLMPEGLEENLMPQGVADLLEFLMGAQAEQ
jgi:putative heme-binding domain-containing protein